jgi:MalQ N-terminal beta sandwich domain/4-alpha-glucanotransferase
MNPDAPLARLAYACGFEHGYHDIWGNWHALREDTARRLLGAMGIDATNDEAIEAALRSLDAERWSDLLPPVCVHRENEPISIPVALSAGEDDGTVHWRLREEGGNEHAGTLVAHEHELLEETELDGQRFRRRRFTLACAPGLGYHEVTVRTGSREHSVKFFLTPARCQAPPNGESRRRPWGIALQLYGLRSQRNWGMGDLGDLARAATVFGQLGADLIGINPLHALYPDEPERASPYSPSSRRFANALYLDVEAIAEFAQCDSARALVDGAAFQKELERLRACELVDYAAVVALKWPVLRGSGRWRFAGIRKQGGQRCAGTPSSKCCMPGREAAPGRTSVWTPIRRRSASLPACIPSKSSFMNTCNGCCSSRSSMFRNAPVPAACVSAFIATSR